MRETLKVASAKESIKKRYPERYETGADEIGVASDYISDIRSLKPGQRVVTYCRVSSCAQENSNNHSDQEENLKPELEQLGFTVIESFQEVGSGWREGREALMDAARHALDNDAIVVAESVTRFIRNRHYNSKTNWKVTPNKAEYRRLQLDTQGVKLVTLLDPDASAEEIRSNETKRGKKLKGNPGGRPKKCFPGYKKREREQSLPKVLALYKKEMTIAAIARSMKLNYNTVYSWIKKND